MLDAPGDSGTVVRLWCDRCGRRLEDGEPLYITKRRWHDPVEGVTHRTSVCPDCRRLERRGRR